MAKILLVEDDNNLREIYEARLMAEGYDIVSARDGEEALTVAMKERPDLIISDVMMPKISGFDMLDIIRSTEETKNAKVIMMTALSQAEDKERATKLGADRYLVKSQVTLEDVAKVAREVLAGESAGTPATAETASTPPAIAQTPTAPEPVVTQTPPAPSTPVAQPEPTTQPSTPSQPEPDATTTQPVVQEPVSPTPVVSTAAVSDDATSAPTQADATDNTQEVASKAMEAIMPQTNTEPSEVNNEQPIEDEQSAIAAQIESFIETSKTQSTQGNQETQPLTQTTSPSEVTTNEAPENSTNEQVAAEEEPENTPEDNSQTTKKKVIQPISDPLASKGPDLEDLLKKEEEKQQMQEIAKTVAAEKADVADERSAEAILKNAAAHPFQEQQTTNPENDTPQVAITENGDLNVVEEPSTEEIKTTEPAPDTAEQQPVIPHQNGSSMDGVIPSPQPPTQTQQTTPNPAPQATAAPAPAPENKPATDPDSIAL
jgi:CheY-like chemotaxis protein